MAPRVIGFLYPLSSNIHLFYTWHRTAIFVYIQYCPLLLCYGKASFVGSFFAAEGLLRVLMTVLIPRFSPSEHISPLLLRTSLGLNKAYLVSCRSELIPIEIQPICVEIHESLMASNIVGEITFWCGSQLVIIWQLGFIDFVSSPRQHLQYRWQLFWREDIVS